MNTAHENLRQLIREDDLQGDAWGTVMSWLFNIAAELWHRGECPAEWEYSPGAASEPRELGEPVPDYLVDVDTDALVQFGNVLQRYRSKLVVAGEDY